MVNIKDIAAIVDVRNHILTIQNLNRSSYLNKDDWRKLDEKRAALDKKFVDAVLDLDVNKVLIKPVRTSIKSKESKYNKQLSFDGFSDTKQQKVKLGS